MKEKVNNGTWNTEIVSVWYNTDTSTYEIVDNETGDIIQEMYDGNFLDEDDQVDYEKLNTAIVYAVQNFIFATVEPEIVKQFEIPEEVVEDILDNETRTSYLGDEEIYIKCVLAKHADAYVVYKTPIEDSTTINQVSVVESRLYFTQEDAIAEFEKAKNEINGIIQKIAKYHARSPEFFDVMIAYEIEAVTDYGGGSFDYTPYGVFKSFSEVKEALKNEDNLADFYIHTVLIAKRNQKTSEDEYDKETLEAEFAEFKQDWTEIKLANVNETYYYSNSVMNPIRIKV